MHTDIICVHKLYSLNEPHNKKRSHEKRKTTTFEWQTKYITSRPINFTFGHMHIYTKHKQTMACALIRIYHTDTYTSLYLENVAYL